MPVCVPIKDLKDTATFTRTIQNATGPVTVTKNGYDVFVVMKSNDYEAIQEELAKARLFSRIAQAEKEYATEQYLDSDQVISSLKEKYDV